MLEFWYRLIDRHGKKKVVFLTYLTLVALLALWFRLLLGFELYHSAMLYILVPYVVSVLITFFRSYKTPTTKLKKFFSHILTAITILFSTSILVGEGFICILFFTPIYLIIVCITYLGAALFTGKEHKYSSALPVIVLLVSLEGTTASLSLPRDTSVVVNRSTSLSVEQIKENLAKPFDLNKDRNWLISVFPMPYHIDAGSLKEGDVHTVYTRYHRWFVTNTHEGKAELLIEHVGENKIKTRVLSDSTYFSTYLSGSGTEIELIPNAAGGTDISLRLNYRRNLDPAWYFHPLQKYGVTKMGELLIKEIMVRENI